MQSNKMNVIRVCIFAVQKNYNYYMKISGSES